MRLPPNETSSNAAARAFLSARAGIALGTNLGDRLANLKRAREEISRLRMVHSPILASSIYETDPVDCEPEAPRFLNAVMEVTCESDAAELLQCLRQIEAAAGRPLRHERNASRTLDLDLLYCGDAIVATADLELPHPRMHLRRFVLEPLGEIRPDLILPNCRQNVAALLRGLEETGGLVRVASQW